jgi:two-component system response regulator FixJ
VVTDKKLVHIVDDEDAIRRSASYMLKTSGYAVETWQSGAAFLREVRHVAHGCILLDVRMPDIDGLAVQRTLAERGVTMPIVIMTGHGDVSISVQAMKAGAVDFLEKPFEKVVLIAAIEDAFARIAASSGASARAAEAEKILGCLTARERDVLEGLAQGLPNKTIAYDLGISPRTVEVHRARIMDKLDAKNAADLVRLVLGAGRH